MSVIYLETDKDLGAERVLHAALDARLDFCIVLGRDEDGIGFFEATTNDTDLLVAALERVKTALIVANLDAEP